MFNSRSPLSIFVALFLFIGLVSTAPVVPNHHAAAPARGHAAPPTRGRAHQAKAQSCAARLRPRSSRILLGYNGFNGTPRDPQPSAGGELGGVFYIADAIDLAKFFAHGADASKDYVCMVYADADAWAAQPKVWVPANAPLGNAMNAHYPGSVLFASHTNAGLPTGSPGAVHQMGIRADQLKRLGVTVECHPKSCFANDHQSLAYDTMKAHWHIQQAP